MPHRAFAMLCLAFLVGCSAGSAPEVGRGGGGCGGPLGGVLPVDPATLAYDFTEPSANDGLSARERALYEVLMAHRASLGLPRIPLSKSLTLVAGRHAEDTARNILPAGGPKRGTNMHSWSNMDYFPNHANARLMWEAPRRLGTQYCSNGYEISALGHDAPADALATWLASPAHRPVIENTGIWRGRDWQAIGIGYAPAPGSAFGSVWHVWFGHQRDPAGAP